MRLVVSGAWLVLISNGWHSLNYSNCFSFASFNTFKIQYKTLYLRIISLILLLNITNVPKKINKLNSIISIQTKEKDVFIDST